MAKTLSLTTVSATLLLWSGCATARTSPHSAGPLAMGKSRYAAFGTNKVHFVTVGKGRHTIVFIHGWSCNCGFWREQFQRWQTKRG